MIETAINAAMELAVMAGCKSSGMCCGNGICEDAGRCLSGRNDEYAAAIEAFLNAPPPTTETIKLHLGEVSAQGMRGICAYHR